MAHAPGSGGGGDSDSRLLEESIMSRSDLATVFCATDFSENAEPALRQAVALATRHEARLVLAHALEPLPVDPYPMPIGRPDAELEIRKAVEDRLAALAERVRRDSGLAVEAITEVGPPGPHLVDMARQAEADVIVIGTRGLTGLKHLVLGSTAEHVVRRADCPVVTVHPGDDPISGPMERVVVPTDLSEDAESAVETLDLLFGDGDRPAIDLVFADSTPPYLESMSHEELAAHHQPDARREELEASLGPLVENIRGRGFDVEVFVVDGAAVEALVAHAEHRGADLIAMSTHGRSALVNALLGRTAQRVVQHATCPVVTVCPSRRR